MKNTTKRREKNYRLFHPESEREVMSINYKILNIGALYRSV